MRRTLAVTLRSRRERLASRLGGESAIFASGFHRPRNYAASTYPFRASSHFVWLTGLNVPGAYFLLEGKHGTIFLRRETEEDRVWRGAGEDWGSIEESTGLVVRDLAELADRIRASRPLALPPPDPAGRERLMELLGRLARADASEGDRKLALAMIECRLEHDEAAVAEMRKAARATALAHATGRRECRPGNKEWQVMAAMVAEIHAQGMQPAYGPIVTVRGEGLHCESYGNRLRKGDLLLADVGAESPGGWASDVTRTWPASGRLSATQREIYEVVLAAQLEAIASVAPGVRYRDVHLVACRAITRGLVDLGILRGNIDELVADGIHAIFFPHGVGHLLGLDVHDMEDLGDLAGYGPGRERSSQFGLSYLRLDRELAPGMAVTIEPGFYRIPALLDSPAWRAKAAGRVDFARAERFKDVRGIRIEDDVLVTAGGREVLTRSIPKKPGEISR